jgi:hypothetical protein
MFSALSIEAALAFVTVSNVLRLVGLWLGYRLLVALYNISPFHPLYKFPGPRLAAASYLYEAWYDLIKVGKYTWEIKDMHDKYGMSFESDLAKSNKGILIKVLKGLLCASTRMSSTATTMTLSMRFIHQWATGYVISTHIS